MTKLSRYLLVIFCFLCLSESRAQTIDSIYYGWTVYEYGEDSDNRQCYIGSSPVRSETSYTGFREPYILITRYDKSRTEEISINSGYEYKINSNVFVLIGGRQFSLFTNNDMAWTTSDVYDKQIIQMMLTNDAVKVRSDAAIGHYAVDDYSMKGIARAYARMRALCP